MSTTTTETLKAIAMLRESFEMGSDEWWDCVRWAERVVIGERREREARIADALTKGGRS